MQITTTTISSSSSVPELITVDDSTDEQQVDDSTNEQQDEGVVFSVSAVHCLKKLRNYLLSRVPELVEQDSSDDDSSDDDSSGRYLRGMLILDEMKLKKMEEINGFAE